MKRYMAGDFLIMAETIIIGLAEVAHLAAIVLGWPFARCTAVFGGLACAALLTVACLLVLRKHYLKKQASGENRAVEEIPVKDSSTEKGKGSLQRGFRALRVSEGGMYAVFALLFLTQLIFIYVGDTSYRAGDLTVETVGSFLATDSLYSVNPLTGFAYTEGLPARLKILCLPTLYGSLCRLTGLSPVTVVRRVIPVITLVSCYIAFYGLSAALFPDEDGSEFRVKRACFMTVVSLLMWVGGYQYGMDGFDLLCGGWMGVTIRNLVLVPWMLSLCLRRKWLSAVLCVLAECCIVWTLYGCGVCLFLLLGMAGIWLCSRKFGQAGKRVS